MTVIGNSAYSSITFTFCENLEFPKNWSPEQVPKIFAYTVQANKGKLLLQEYLYQTGLNVKVEIAKSID